MARMLTETTDFKPSIDDIKKHVDLGSLASSISEVMDDDEDCSIASDLFRCLANGSLPRLESALVRHYADCENLERSVIESEKENAELEKQEFKING